MHESIIRATKVKPATPRGWLVVHWIGEQAITVYLVKNHTMPLLNARSIASSIYDVPTAVFAEVQGGLRVRVLCVHVLFSYSSRSQ